VWDTFVILSLESSLPLDPEHGLNVETLANFLPNDRRGQGNFDQICGRTISEYGRNVSEHGRNIGEYGRNVSEYGRQVSKYDVLVTRYYKLLSRK